jgi:hypothetical protein
MAGRRSPARSQGCTSRPRRAAPGAGHRLLPPREPRTPSRRRCILSHPSPPKARLKILPHGEADRPPATEPGAPQSFSPCGRRWPANAGRMRGRKPSRLQPLVRDDNVRWKRREGLAPAQTPAARAQSLTLAYSSHTCASNGRTKGEHMSAEATDALRTVTRSPEPPTLSSRPQRSGEPKTQEAKLCGCSWVPARPYPPPGGGLAKRGADARMRIGGVRDDRFLRPRWQFYSRVITPSACG